MKTLKLEDIKFELIAEYEDISIRGNVVDSGDPDYDKEVEDKIIDAVEGGDVWAWASVEVKGSYKGLTASTYLGCCSYASQDDFESDGYYQDMQQDVLNDINEQLADLLKD